MKEKRLALVTTCGYPEKEAVPFLEKLIQYEADFAGLRYVGALSLNNAISIVNFQTPELIEKTKTFTSAINYYYIL